jgi:hypothetical protein
MHAAVVGQLTEFSPPATGFQTPETKSTPPVVTQSEVGQLMPTAPPIAVTAQLMPSVVARPSPHEPTAAHTVAVEQLTPEAPLVDAYVKVDHVVPPLVVLIIFPASPGA